MGYLAIASDKELPPSTLFNIAAIISLTFSFSATLIRMDRALSTGRPASSRACRSWVKTIRSRLVTRWKTEDISLERSMFNRLAPTLAGSIRIGI